jgi:nucleotide-binding universal stress UspA family protein
VIKRILVPLDPSPFSRSAVETACRIAKPWNAEVHGLVILDVRGIEDEIGPVPLGGSHYADHLEKHKLEEAEARISGLLASFRETCSRHGTLHHEAELQGSPSRSIIDRSGLYDLVVTGLATYFRFETDDKPGDGLDQLLAHSSTPVLGVTEKGPGWEYPDGPIRILAAWDASPAAASSFRQCLQTFAPDKIHLRLVRSGGEKAGAEASLNLARGYAESYGAGAVETEWTSQSIIDAVAERHASWAHLIVVGVHAKNGPLDFMVGSLTKTLIHEKKNPLFIGL